MRSGNPVRWSDLDSTIDVNPDEAGLFDLLAAAMRKAPDRPYYELQDEVDLVIQTGINPDHEVLEIGYSHNGDERTATITGIPDGRDLGVWFINLRIKS